MSPIQFFNFLRKHYTINGQHLYGNYSFSQWLLKKDNTLSFQFNLLKQKKAIPQQWLTEAKDALNRGVKVDREWFNTQYGSKHNNDCRASVALWLLEQHK